MRIINRNARFPGVSSRFKIKGREYTLIGQMLFTDTGAYSIPEKYGQYLMYNPIPVENEEEKELMYFIVSKDGVWVDNILKSR